MVGGGPVGQPERHDESVAVRAGQHGEFGDEREQELIQPTEAQVGLELDPGCA